MRNNNEDLSIIKQHEEDLSECSFRPKLVSKQPPKVRSKSGIDITIEEGRTLEEFLGDQHSFLEKKNRKITKLQAKKEEELEK
jgi:hypothetical protein